MLIAQRCEESGPPKLISQGTAGELYTTRGSKWTLGEEVRRGAEIKKKNGRHFCFPSYSAAIATKHYTFHWQFIWKVLSIQTESQFIQLILLGKVVLLNLFIHSSHLLSFKKIFCTFHLKHFHTGHTTTSWKRRCSTKKTVAHTSKATSKHVYSPYLPLVPFTYTQTLPLPEYHLVEHGTSKTCISSPKLFS